MLPRSLFTATSRIKLAYVENNCQPEANEQLQRLSHLSRSRRLVARLPVDQRSCPQPETDRRKAPNIFKSRRGRLQTVRYRLGFETTCRSAPDPVVVVPAAPIAARNLPFSRWPSNDKTGPHNTGSFQYRYALFQAANKTAIMPDAPSDRKGVASGLLGPARNLGLITGASAMGAVFSVGSHGIELLGLPHGRATGMSLTFGVATLIAAIAGGITVWGMRTAPQRERDTH